MRYLRATLYLFLLYGIGTTISVAQAIGTVVSTIPQNIVSADQKGVPNGIASLGSDGKVPAAQLPAGTGGTGCVPVGSGGLLYWDGTSCTVATQAQVATSLVDTTKNSADSFSAGSNGDSTIPTPTAGKDITAYNAAANERLRSINGRNYYLTPQTTANVVLTDGTTITWSTDGVRLPNASVTLIHTTATRSLVLTGLVDGESGVLYITQDATGGASLTLGTSATSGQCSAWKIAGGGAGAVTLSPSANAIDILTFSVKGTVCYGTLMTNFN